MKRVWVKAKPGDKGMVLITLEGRADSLLLPEGKLSHVKRRRGRHVGQLIEERIEEG